VKEGWGGIKDNHSVVVEASAMDVPVQTKESALSLIIEHQDRIKALGVKRLGLFGSFVREEHGLESDVDVLVEFEQDRKTFDNFIQLSFLLEDLFRRRVELVTAESLSPHIGPFIMSEVEYVTVVT
jgi:predicted nucleotidyltransferase